MGNIYFIGKKTKNASRVKVYKDFGQCKRCGYALDNKEAENVLCRPCQEQVK